MSKELKLWITSGIILGIIFGGIFLQNFYVKKERELTKAFDTEVAHRRKNWEAERSKKKAEYRAALEAAWGGGIQAVVKDPENDIQTMLQKVTKIACPSSSSIEVEVDNFTEFDVYITGNAKLSQKEVTHVVKSLLGECEECVTYVNSISFVYQDSIVKMLDKRGIDGIPNWKSVDDATVSRAFITP